MKRLLPSFATLVLFACGTPAPELVLDEEPVGGAAGATATKFDMWLSPSYFRGFDVGYWNENDGNKDLSDFQALKDTGATLAQIQSTQGTRNFEAPYGPNSLGIDALDELVGFCNQVGLQYVIAVREGPGRQSVDNERRDTIWENGTEQQLYAEMLRDDIVARYQTDPLFVGINVMVEPNPFNEEISNGTISSPDELEQAMSARGIDVNAMMTRFIAAVRELDATLPVIVQAVGWSGPDWFELLEKQSDPYVVYDFHTYEPRAYTHPDCDAPNCAGLTWPGTYEGSTWDRAYLENEFFQELIAFEEQHDVPIFMGEFGMQYEQPGGVQFLSDLVDIAISRGWHFCLWSFRSDTLDPLVLSFDAEKWDPAYWAEILGWFQ